MDSDQLRRVELFSVRAKVARRQFWNRFFSGVQMQGYYEDTLTLQRTPGSKTPFSAALLQ